jgi:hypothetical protein
MALGWKRVKYNVGHSIGSLLDDNLVVATTGFDLIRVLRFLWIATVSITGV